MNKNNIISLDRVRARQQAHRLGERWTLLPAAARRVALDDLGEFGLPALRRCLAAWHARTGADGVYRLGRDGRIADLGATGLLGPYSLVVTTTDGAPDGWIVSYAGEAVDALDDGPTIVGRRFVDLPLKGVSATAAKTIAAVLPERRVAAHHICAQLADGAVSYVRLTLPLADWHGRVTRFITASEIVDEAESPGFGSGR